MSDKMRSRTEMVTTTFVDSEEDYSDDDDSEEDWRPSASSKNGKKQKQQKCGGSGSAKRGRKRKSSSGQGNKNSKRKAAYEDSEEDEIDEPSEDDHDYDDFEIISGSSRKKPANLPPKKQFSDKNSSTLGKDDDETGDTLNLLVYVKDLSGTDINKNNRLCLWRKDNNNLLQKYIRVKTAPEQYLFTSSSVYSSFDDKRIADFYDIKVKSTDSSNRRVKIINPSELQKIFLKASKNKNSSDEKSDTDEAKQMCIKSKVNLNKTYKTVSTHHEEDEDDDDDEEEVEEENDEEEDDCDLEGDDDDDIEEDDECDDD